ncbi:MAG: response regulator [Clostridia bacterium]|nr:response regulator [Clostridia bacterium]NCC43894.1 response regulator [Clostridia bacterium]
MKTILVDDELWMLELFEEESAGIEEIQMVGKFDDAEDALHFAKENRVDLAFLDIEMPGMNGLELSDHLREIYPDIIIIFVSAYDQHMKSAMKDHDADWFLLKPYNEEEVKRVLERAKALSIRQRKEVRIHTFGKFEIYVNGAPVKFSSPKAKELLAVLVDSHGEPITAEEAYSRMWMEKTYHHENASSYRRSRSKLLNVLKENGIENILAYFPYALAIRPDMVTCDYFELLKEEKEAIRDFKGEYMIEYFWGEERIPRLNSIKRKHDPYADDELYD